MQIEVDNTLRDLHNSLLVYSNLIGSLSRTIQQYSPPSEWIMCELGVFPIFLRIIFLNSTKSQGWHFLGQEKTSNISKRRFSIYYSWVLCSMDCLQLQFIGEEAVSWTQRFLTRKIWPQNEVYLWQTNLKANVCRNSTFQVNTRKNATWRRRLTSRNRIAIFVSTSCEERHNKPFWL